MESRRKRSRSQLCKWGGYTLLMLLCTVLQTTPGLFQLGEAKPLYLLPLSLAVALFEDEFSGALFGVVCGLMWDGTAGRTVGLLAIALMLLSFTASVIGQLFLKCSALNFALVAAVATLLLLSCDFLFFYVMPGYSGAAERFVRFVLPVTALTIPISVCLFAAVRGIRDKFRIDTGIL